MARFKKRAQAFKFKPFSNKQLRLMNWWREYSPHADKDIIIVDGAIRSGKTIACICSFMQWSLSTFKNEEFIIAGKSIGSLKRNVIEPLKQIVTGWGLTFEHNRSENYLIIGGNTYYLFGANNESSQDVLQGLTAAGAFADEAALFPRSFIDQMIGRCSVEGSKIFMNCNPKGPYHYLKTDFIDKAKEKNIYRLHFTMEDNLTLAESTKRRYRLQYQGGVFFMRYILGQWVMAEGVIYDMFNKDLHTVKTEPRNYSEYYVSIDYGTQNPTTFGLWGKLGRTWYKVKEYYHSGRGLAGELGKQKTDTEYADDLEDFLGDVKVKAVILDPSAASFRAELKKRKFRVRKAKNAVVDGIRNVGTALIEGLIKYNDVCVETFREFSSYVWDEKAQERGEDKPIKQNDHAMDADRYFVSTVVLRRSGMHLKD